MATKKVGLTKLITKKQGDVKTIEINGETIEVKQYLPLEEKLGMVRDIGLAAIGEQYINPVTLDVLLDIKLVQYYTNINFTEKQLEETEKLYDTLVLNDIVNAVINALPLEEIDVLRSWVFRTVNEVSTFRNSAMGIMETINKNYDATKLDLEALNSELRTPEMQEFVKNLPNMG